MSSPDSKIAARFKRKKSIRKKISGTSERPRLSVFRSHLHMYAQIIDDTRGHTVASASSTEKTVRENAELGDKKTVADFVGQLAAKRAKEKGIKKVVFDRNGFLYHGRVKAVSEGARKAGLIF